jgi:hypothetical protein
MTVKLHRPNLSDDSRKHAMYSGEEVTCQVNPIWICANNSATRYKIVTYQETPALAPCNRQRANRTRVTISAYTVNQLTPQLNVQNRVHRLWDAARDPSRS